MGRRKPRTGKRQFVGIEPGLQKANEEFITPNRRLMHETKILVTQITQKLVAHMKKQSPVFASFYVRKFGAGSSFEGLKVGTPGEFDIDVLLKLPLGAEPLLVESNIPGYVHLRLQNINGSGNKILRNLVDGKGYLLTTSFKSFVQSVLAKTLNEKFPGNVVPLGRRRYQISGVQTNGPAFTLSVDGAHFHVSIDLVPCVLFDKADWPKTPFRPNPTSDDFFVAAKSPKGIDHEERYWSLSFQMQERRLIFDRVWLKPTLRILKCVRHYFDQKVSSYALKTMFLRQLFDENPNLHESAADLWKSPLSYCVVYMLRRYAECLGNHEIRYFWNKKNNLLYNLSEEQMNQYRREIEGMIRDIESDPSSATIGKYLDKNTILQRL